MKSVKEAIKKWLIPSSDDQEEITTSKKKVALEEDTSSKKKRKTPRVFTLMTYMEAQDVAHYLLLDQAVIVNVGNLITKDKYRVIDFLSGVIYALDGERIKLDQNIYLFTPKKAR